MMQCLRSLLLGLALCLLGPLAHADTRVVIVSSDSTAAYMEAAQALIDELARAGVSAYDLRRLSVAEWLVQPAQAPPPRIYVTFGAQATAALAASQLSAPVLAALIPRSSFERVLRSSARKASANFTAIYLDQPLQRQLASDPPGLATSQTPGCAVGAGFMAQCPGLADAGGGQRSVFD